MRGTTVALTVFALALPAAAGAQVVDPGQSGVDQYQESIPGAGGDRPTGPNASRTGKGSAGSDGGSGTGAVPSQSGTGAVPGQARVSPTAAQRLKELGPEGKETLGAAAATAPSPPQSSAGSDSGGSGPSLGWAFPVILALALAAALTLAVLRWRRGTPPGAA